jgi:hypothetical protein
MSSFLTLPFLFVVRQPQMSQRHRCDMSSGETIGLLLSHFSCLCSDFPTALLFFLAEIRTAAAAAFQHPPALLELSTSTGSPLTNDQQLVEDLLYSTAARNLTILVFKKPIPEVSCFALSSLPAMKFFSLRFVGIGSAD